MNGNDRQKTNHAVLQRFSHGFATVLKMPRLVSPNGDEILRLRLKLGMPIEAVANDMGVHHETLSKIEKGGKCRPSTLKIVANYYNVELEDIEIFDDKVPDIPYNASNIAVFRWIIDFNVRNQDEVEFLKQAFACFEALSKHRTIQLGAEDSSIVPVCALHIDDSNFLFDPYKGVFNMDAPALTYYMAASRLNCKNERSSEGVRILEAVNHYIYLKKSSSGKTLFTHEDGLEYIYKYYPMFEFVEST